LNTKKIIKEDLRFSDQAQFSFPLTWAFLLVLFVIQLDGKDILVSSDNVNSVLNVARIILDC
jgi:hypothetical protein